MAEGPIDLSAWVRETLKMRFRIVGRHPGRFSVSVRPDLFAVAAAIMTIAGCGGELVDFRAQVLLDGEPLANATVTLVGTGASRGRSVVGMSDRDGFVRFMTLEPNDGVKPGEYKVTVIKAPGAGDQGQLPKEYDAENPEDVARMLGVGTSGFVPFARTAIPRVYLNASETPLSVTVPKSVGEPVVLELDTSLGKRKPKSRN